MSEAGTAPGVGDRVIYVDGDRPPRESLGTVVEDNGATVAVDLDRGPLEACYPVEGVRVLGCEACEGTGIQAERREGVTYPTPCAECAGDLRDRRYWWHAEEYRLTAVV